MRASRWRERGLNWGHRGRVSFVSLSVIRPCACFHPALGVAVAPERSRAVGSLPGPIADSGRSCRPFPIPSHPQPSIRHRQIWRRGASAKSPEPNGHKCFDFWPLQRGRGMLPVLAALPGSRWGSAGDASLRGLQTRPAGYLHFDDFCYAVVKVPPSVGCVKYKAQDIVLSPQILGCQRLRGPRPQKPLISPVEFSPGRQSMRIFIATSSLPTPMRLGPHPSGRKAQD